MFLPEWRAVPYSETSLLATLYTTQPTVKDLDLCGLMEPTAGEVKPACLTVDTVPGEVPTVLTAGM